jgi:hypothetical protein
MTLPGKRIPRTRLVRTDNYVVAVQADPSEPVYEPATIELLRQIERHAKDGDVEWLKRHGKVYAAMNVAS